MTDISRIRAALEFMKDNQGLRVGGLFLSHLDNVVYVTGSTSFYYIENINKKIAIKELEDTKAEFNEYAEDLPELKTFLTNKEIKYTLILDYGKGGINICSEINGVITWECQISD